MIEITGLYNTARCFCRDLEPTAAKQIKAVCDQEEFKGNKIRIMPDVHAGLGCTIGTTMTITNKVVPGMVGVDIGCGMETIRLDKRELDLERLDQVVRHHIPSGFHVRKSHHPLNELIDLDRLYCADSVNLPRARCSIGTLGGGNHFIEVDRDDAGQLYLVVHSGSRHLGNEVARYYQKAGYQALYGQTDPDFTQVITQLKASGRIKEINQTLQDLKKPRLPQDLAYVQGNLFKQYLHDMNLVQHFASLNRQAMVEVILTQMGLSVLEHFTTIHNYIDPDQMILRKGAVSARQGELLLIPINMRDGSLICRGKGNADWNWSAPHGAGRLLSRREAQKTLSLQQFHREMSGIFSTSISKDTLDEAPMAYKPMAEIIDQIEPTAEIMKIIRPIYNFKAQE